jgi:hypothetical protein
MTTALRRLEGLRRWRTRQGLAARLALARSAAALASLEDRHRALIVAEEGARRQAADHGDPATVGLAWAYADAQARRRAGAGAERTRARHEVDTARALVAARRSEEAALALVCRRRRARRDVRSQGRT